MKIETKSPLVVFFYLLLRDKLPAGDVENLVKEASASILPAVFSSAGVGAYAVELAGRLTPPAEAPEERTCHFCGKAGADVFAHGSCAAIYGEH